ncbi:MAG: hypothetical protein HKN45_03665, partial [Flavobacteriales bacterium]|nr:hypothetical protein [Flavobacteriales bacterium]
MRIYPIRTKALVLSFFFMALFQNIYATCGVSIPTLSVQDECAVLPNAPTGDGPVEFMWAKNEGGNIIPLTPFSTSTDLTYCPTEDGYYRICARVVGCSNIIEGDDIHVNVCGANFEHVDVHDETGCNTNDGSITHDPYINLGTVLPYYVTYTYEGSLFTFGPYTHNQDYTISGLSPGVYEDFTMIDADGCEDNYGDITIEEYTIGCCQLTVDLGPDQVLCEGGSVLLNASFSGANCDPCENSYETTLDQFDHITGCHICEDDFTSTLNSSYSNNNLDEIDFNDPISDPDQVITSIEVTFNVAAADFDLSQNESYVDDVPYSYPIELNGVLLGHFNPTELPYTCNVCEDNSTKTVTYNFDPNTQSYNYGGSNTLDLNFYSYGQSQGELQDVCVANIGLKINTECANTGEPTILWSDGSAGPTLSVDQSGTYSVTVTDCQGCTASDEVEISISDLSVSLGDDIELCGEDEVSLTASVTGEAACEIYCERTVTNTVNCNGGQHYQVWLPNSGNNYFTSDNAVWREYPDGTATYTATLTNGTDIIEYEAFFSGGTSTPPTDSPKNNNCGSTDATGWFYYPVMTGSFTSQNHGTFQLSRKGESFQLGQGANITSTQHGASGWTYVTGGDGFYNDGDINIDLSLACVEQGGGELTYLWSTGATTQSLTVTESGTYTVTVTDCLGCSASDTVDVNLKPLVSVGDYVWEDTNGNGCQDDDEAGVEGLTLTLYECGDDGSGNPTTSGGTEVASTTSDSNGFYEFTDCFDPNTFYYINISGVPAGFELTQQDACGDDTSDSDANSDGDTECFNIPPGGNPDVDFGISGLPNVGDYVFFDTDRDGIQDPGEEGVEGVTVNLISAGPDGEFHTLDDVIVATEVTDADGLYLFEDVVPGLYCIEFLTTTLPADYVFTGEDQGGDDELDSDADEFGKTDPFTVVSGQDDDLSYDAGIFQPTASLGDYVFFDEDRDGVQDPGEGGVEGVTVELYICGEDTPIATTTTDENGFYIFEGLEPNTEYYVVFNGDSLPADYQFTAQDAGGDDTTDSDADENG